MNGIKLKIYGCRGSIPSGRRIPSKYGSNTTCMTIETGGQTLILDAGSGLAQMDRFVKLFKRVDEPFDILLSHLHIDHIIGLTVFSQLWVHEDPVRIYTLSRDDRPLKEQVFSPFNPPYWPVSMSRFGNVECVEIALGRPFAVGGFTVTPFESSHPDGACAFCIENGGRKIVYLIDNEMRTMPDKARQATLEYCRNADMVIFDAAYSDIDYPDKKGWGHSSIGDGIALAAESGCKRMLFSHLSFEYSDQEMEMFEAGLTHGEESFFFARDGMEIYID